MADTWQRATVDIVFHDTTCGKCSRRIIAGTRAALVQVRPPGPITEPWCVDCLGEEASGRFEVLLGPPATRR